MEAFSTLLNHISSVIWGPVTLTLLLGVGIYLTVGLRAMPWRYTIAAFKLFWRGRPV
ncbi:Sodium/glycine symporter GlyP, partial [hydrothermal vent metagenome]